MVWPPDSVQARFFNSGHDPIAEVVPGLGRAVSIGNIRGPSSCGFWRPVSDGDGLLDAEHRKIEPSSGIGMRAGRPVAGGDLEGAELGDRVIARHTPAAPSLSSNHRLQTARPAAGALNAQFLGSTSTR